MHLGGDSTNETRHWNGRRVAAYKKGHREDSRDCPDDDSYSNLASDAMGEDGSIVQRVSDGHKSVKAIDTNTLDSTSPKLWMKNICVMHASKATSGALNQKTFEHGGQGGQGETNISQSQIERK